MKLFQFCNKSVVPEELVQYNHNNFMEVQYDEEDVYDLLSVPFYHHNNDTFKFQNRKVKTKCPISKDNSDDHDYVQTQRFSKKSCFSSMQNFKKSVKCNKPKYHAEYSSKIGTSSDGGTCRKKKTLHIEVDRSHHEQFNQFRDDKPHSPYEYSRQSYWTNELKTLIASRKNTCRVRVQNMNMKFY